MTPRTLIRAAVPAVALLASLPSSLRAEPLPGFELERLQLDPGAQTSLLVGAGELLPRGGWRISLTGHYERNPLVVFEEGQAPQPLVSNRATTHLALGYAPLAWLEVGLQVPVVAMQDGLDLSAQSLDRPSRFGLSTPDVSARVGLLSQRNGQPLDLAAELGVGLPIGNALALARESGFRIAPKLSVGRSFGAFRLGLDVSGVVRTASSTLTPLATPIQDELGNELRGAATVATTGNGIRLEADLLGALSLTRAPSAMEALAGARVPLGKSWEVFALGGMGFGARPGTPLFRVLAGVAFGSVRTASVGPAPVLAPQPRPVIVQPKPVEQPKAPDLCAAGAPHAPADCPELDDDGDGVKNAADRCPTEKGPEARQGCPLKDTDGDGLSDELDGCPTEKGPAELRGCPAKDADGDGVADEADKCPAEAGPAERDGCPLKDADGDGVADDADRCPAEQGPAERQGCPAKDADGDGVLDDVDTCPNEKGVPQNAGCPKKQKALVVIRPDKLELKGKIFFNYRKTTIGAMSYPLLNQVARVLKEHPGLRLRVEGHTDNVGPEPGNVKLSQRRAESVVRYLVRKGVEPGRLAAQGYGSARPVASNKTKIGQDLNRRVEFIIIRSEQSGQPSR